MRFLFAALLFLSSAQAAERATTITADGRTIQVLIHRSDSALRQVPTVVIAPGQGYHMELPLLEELAESLADQGFTTYRFNWNYFTSEPKGEPSVDLEKEVLDMQAVVALARTDQSVDSAHLMLAGKSLGSLVAYRVYQREPALKALALLTPVCTASYDDKDQPLPAPIPSGNENYPELIQLTRPVLFATSDKDPNCQLPMLFDFLRPMGGRIPVTVVGGNHSWDLVKGVDEATNALNKANRRTGIGFVTRWLGMNFQ